MEPQTPQGTGMGTSIVAALLVGSGEDVGMAVKDWEFAYTLWHVVAALLVVTAIFVGVAWIWQPKRVDGYYLSRGSQANTGNVCVYAHWTWHPDELAFCTDRYADAVEFATKANAALKASQ